MKEGDVLTHLIKAHISEGIDETSLVNCLCAHDHHQQQISISVLRLVRNALNPPPHPHKK